VFRGHVCCETMLARALERRLYSVESELDQKLERERTIYLNALAELKEQVDAKLQGIVLFLAQLTEEVDERCALNSQTINEVKHLSFEVENSLFACSNRLTSLTPSTTLSPLSPGNPPTSTPAMGPMIADYSVDLESRVAALEALCYRMPMIFSNADEISPPTGGSSKPLVQTHMHQIHQDWERDQQRQFPASRADYNDTERKKPQTPNMSNEQKPTTNRMVDSI